LKLYYKDEYCTLLQGDCLEGMQKMIDKNMKFDAIITDIPYGTTACKWDTIIPFDKMWECLKNLRKENSPIVLFGSEPFSSLLRCSNLKEFKYDWIWNKKKGGNPLTAQIQPIKIFEIISIFGKGKTNYFPEMEKRDKIKFRGSNKGTISESNNNAFIENKSYEFKYPKAIVEFSNASQINKFHPTQKPVDLMEYFINTYTKENDVILDFTCGSGSTLVAAKKLNRKCYGIELEEKYCEITKNRLMELDKDNM
jgi:site-specific DNA-methyltransferase (adenine-specific)